VQLLLLLLLLLVAGLLQLCKVPGAAAQAACACGYKSTGWKQGCLCGGVNRGATGVGLVGAAAFPRWHSCGFKLARPWACCWFSP